MPVHLLLQDLPGDAQLHHLGEFPSLGIRVLDEIERDVLAALSVENIRQDHGFTKGPPLQPEGRPNLLFDQNEVVVLMVDPQELAEPLDFLPHRKAAQTVSQSGDRA